MTATDTCTVLAVDLDPMGDDRVSHWVSDWVSDSPATNNQQPSSMHPPQVQVVNARAALDSVKNAEPGEGWVGDVLGLEASR